eukprot:6902391-Pyramimonas_sp.AAC.1
MAFVGARSHPSSSALRSTTLSRLGKESMECHQVAPNERRSTAPPEDARANDDAEVPESDAATTQSFQAGAVKHASIQSWPPQQREQPLQRPVQQQELLDAGG